MAQGEFRGGMGVRNACAALLLLPRLAHRSSPQGMIWRVTYITLQTQVNRIYYFANVRKEAVLGKDV